MEAHNKQGSGRTGHARAQTASQDQQNEQEDQQRKTRGPRNLFNTDAEEDLLACYFDAPATVVPMVRKQCPRLVPLDFHHPDLRAVYQAILDAYDKYGAFAITPGFIELRTGVDRDYLASLALRMKKAGQAPAAAQAPYHALVIREFSELRQIQQFAADAWAGIERGDSSAEVVDLLKRRIKPVEPISLTLGEFLTIDELLQEPDPIDLVAGFLPSVGVAMVHADESNLKSFFTDHLFFHVGLGRRFCGRRVRQGKVIFILNEGWQGFKKRYQAFEKHYGVDLRQHVIVRHPDKDIPPFNLLNPDHIAALLAYIEQLGGVAAVVFDTLSSVLTVNPNGGDAGMLQARMNASNIAAQGHCLAFFVHHNNRQGEIKGASDFYQTADVRLECKAEKDGLLRARGLTITCTKPLRDDEPFPPLHFTVEKVDLPTEENPHRSSLVLIYDRKEPAVQESPIVTTYKDLLKLLVKRGGKAQSGEWEQDANATLGMSHPDFDKRRKAMLEVEHYVSKGKGLQDPYQITAEGWALIGYRPDGSPDPNQSNSRNQSKTILTDLNDAEEISQIGSGSLEPDYLTNFQTIPTGVTGTPQPSPARYTEQAQVLPSDSKQYGALNSVASQVVTPQVKGALALDHLERVLAADDTPSGKMRVLTALAQAAQSEPPPAPVVFDEKRDAKRAEVLELAARLSPPYAPLDWHWITIGEDGTQASWEEALDALIKPDQYFLLAEDMRRAAVAERVQGVDAPPSDDDEGPTVLNLEAMTPERIVRITAPQPEEPMVITDYRQWTFEGALLWLENEAMMTDYRLRRFAGKEYGVGVSWEQRRADWEKKLDPANIDRVTARQLAHEWACELRQSRTARTGHQAGGDTV